MRKKILPVFICVTFVLCSTGMFTGCNEEDRPEYAEFHVYIENLRLHEKVEDIGTYVIDGTTYAHLPYRDSDGEDLIYTFSYEFFYQDTKESTGSRGDRGPGGVYPDNEGIRKWTVTSGGREYSLIVVIESPTIEFVDVMMDPTDTIEYTDNRAVYAYDGEPHYPYPCFEYEGERYYFRDYKWYSASVIECEAGAQARYFIDPGVYSLTYRLLGNECVRPGICCNPRTEEVTVTVEIVNQKV